MHVHVMMSYMIIYYTHIKLNPGGTPSHPQDSDMGLSDHTWDSDQLIIPTSF